jgi:hypothetical protein
MRRGLVCEKRVSELDRTLQLATNAGANLVEELSQLLPAFHRMVADFVRQRGIDGDNPALLAQFDCHEAAHRPIMGCGGRQVVHCLERSLSAAKH